MKIMTPLLPNNNVMFKSKLPVLYKALPKTVYKGTTFYSVFCTKKKNNRCTYLAELDNK